MESSESVLTGWMIETHYCKPPGREIGIGRRSSSVRTADFRVWELKKRRHLSFRLRKGCVRDDANKHVGRPKPNCTAAELANSLANAACRA